MAVNGPDSDQMYPDQVWCVCEQLQVSEITNLAIICGENFSFLSFQNKLKYLLMISLSRQLLSHLK